MGDNWVDPNVTPASPDRAFVQDIPMLITRIADDTPPSTPPLAVASVAVTRDIPIQPSPHVPSVPQVLPVTATSPKDQNSSSASAKLEEFLNKSGPIQPQDLFKKVYSPKTSTPVGYNTAKLGPALNGTFFKEPGQTPGRYDAAYDPVELLSSFRPQLYPDDFQTSGSMHTWPNVDQKTLPLDQRRLPILPPMSPIPFGGTIEQGQSGGQQRPLPSQFYHSTPLRPETIPFQDLSQSYEMTGQVPRYEYLTPSHPVETFNVSSPGSSRSPNATGGGLASPFVAANQFNFTLGEEDSGSPLNDPVIDSRHHNSDNFPVISIVPRDDNYQVLPPAAQSDEFLTNLDQYTKEILNEFGDLMVKDLPAIIQGKIPDGVKKLVPPEMVQAVLDVMLPQLFHKAVQEMTEHTVQLVIKSAMGPNTLDQVLPLMAQGRVACNKPCICSNNLSAPRKKTRRRMGTDSNRRPEGRVKSPRDTRANRSGSRNPRTTSPSTGGRSLNPRSRQGRSTRVVRMEEDEEEVCPCMA